MSSGNRRQSNARLREHLDQHIGNLLIGETFKTEEITQVLREARPTAFVNPKRASMLIRERDDIEPAGRGMWRKVQCGAQA